MSSGVISMPLQRGLINAVSGNGSMMYNYKEAFRPGVAFSGMSACVLFVGMYTLAAYAASKMLQKNTEQEKGFSR